MEAEASLFESSEMLATLMASTPMLGEAWRLCRRAYTIVPWGFAVDQVGDVGYIAFSGLQSVGTGLINSNENNGLVPIDTRLFSSSVSLLRGCEGDKDPPMVHEGFLHLFLSVYNSPGFQTQIVAILEKSKAIIVTGHSIGGTTASLATLWLQSYLQSLSSNLSILCITFGSPLLGNSSLSKSILRQRWGGKFCHVVSKNDIVPRLLLAPITPNIVPQLTSLFHLWLMPMTSMNLRLHLETQLSNQDITELYRYVLAHLLTVATTQEDLMSSSPYRPFGSFLFCSKEGAICLDNATAILQMLYLIFMDGLASSSIDEHLRYGEFVMRDSLQFLKKRCFTDVVYKSSYEVGISSALEASGLIVNHQDSSVIVGLARECLMRARQMGRTPNLNSANLAIRLAKITPYRAQIEWFKTCCDESDDLMGYYDTFKLGGASKRNSKVNMNRIKLASFWDDVIHMLETNQLPYDFHRREKWVNASQFYKLLVEPLDIAYYYRSGTHRTKGHYLIHGRERRYEVFDRWWRGRNVSGDENNKIRSKYAGLTQDSCFWARMEEAREWVESAGRENDVGKLDQLWENIEKFELYARKLVESKEVSKDVQLRNSSYSLWLEDLEELKLRLRRTSLRFPGFFGGQMVP